MKWKDAPLWLQILWSFALVNFASFWIVAVISGGDAVNGKEAGGKYFLANHGRYTEVTKEFFLYSRIHSISAMALLAAAVAAVAWASRTRSPR